MGLRDIFGRNININNEIRERYKNIQEGFIFKDMDNKTRDYKYIFMLCLALGYEIGRKTPVKNPIGLLNVNSFDDNDLWAIAAIAVEDKNELQVIKDGPEMKRIATEFSHTGLGILENLIAENGTEETLELVLEKKAREALKTIKPESNQ